MVAEGCLEREQAVAVAAVVGFEVALVVVVAAEAAAAAVERVSAAAQQSYYSQTSTPYSEDMFAQGSLGGLELR